MHIFKTSLETYDSVIKNKKHAFGNKPKDLYPGDIIIISKNKRGMKFFGYFCFLISELPRI
ncbi:unnamed protein product [marine sediment metagenome]|uniref:Uncharacterized protein n=1 Tax=marine sediment metagenome TaxID=412755 RepID=X1CT98_9ZZZZ